MKKQLNQWWNRKTYQYSLSLNHAFFHAIHNLKSIKLAYPLGHIDLSKGKCWMFRLGLWMNVSDKSLVYLGSILIQRKRTWLKLSLATNLSWCRTHFFLPLQEGADVRLQLICVDIIISKNILFLGHFLVDRLSTEYLLAAFGQTSRPIWPLFWPQGGTGTTESIDWIAVNSRIS